MKIVFFGTSEFAVIILRHLLESRHEVIGVVTKPDQPKGRSLRVQSPPVKIWVEEKGLGIEVVQPVKASAEEFVKEMREKGADVFVVAAYGQLLKEPLLESARYGCVNVHGSLLPKWRGAAPIQRSLMAGEEETGVTIMQMVLEMDAGDMLDEARVRVGSEMTRGELEGALAEAAREPLLRVLEKMEKEGGRVKGRAQERESVTFAPKITPGETEIDWGMGARRVHDLIRALAPEPGAWCWVQVGGERKRMKVKKVRVVEGREGREKETVSQTREEWVVGCGEGAVSLLEVQLEGKKVLPIGEFLRGFHERRPEISKFS